MIVIIPGKKKLTDWEKRRYALILRRIILRAIQFNRGIRDMDKFIDVEWHIIFNGEDSDD